ncbi:hypothetical protein HDU84_000321, partial [Entophlyctis sp. JEL0112]
IQAEDNGLCMDNEGGGSANGNRQMMWPCEDNNPNQIWRPRSDGSICHPATGKCLDLSAGNDASGTAVQIWDCDAQNSNQKWEINRAFMSHKIRAASGGCLDNNGGQQQMHAYIWQCFESNPSQEWYITPE